MRVLAVFLIVFILGCSSKVEYLYVEQPKVEQQRGVEFNIAVQDIKLPYYLKDAKLAYLDDGEIKFFKSAYFGDDGVDFLTNRAITIFEKALNKPKVYRFPWYKKDTKYFVEIEIKKLLADSKNSNIIAQYRIYNRAKNIVKSSSYHDSLLIKSLDKKSVLKSYQELFDKLVQNVSRSISGF